MQQRRSGPTCQMRRQARSRQMRGCGGCGHSSDARREQEVVTATHPANSRRERRVELLAVTAQPIESEMQTMGEVHSKHPLKGNANEMEVVVVTAHAHRTRDANNEWRWWLPQHTPIERETRMIGRRVPGTHRARDANDR